ncbi:hypothetical protein, conserved [Plasmodium gonderi]|uniref:Uncharacterized protein n=1 Tax=Plasmodium gonderi TaxID=77519 RepID=A0A1Y1JHU7_PLAGO|nr:hypothetical protein, conserved [Plasmodium gonderi]GAW82089.1 hypothetical protein, conserved [Plasmodium gonderi]
MSFKEKLQRRENCNEVVYEACGKIDQHFRVNEKTIKHKNDEENFSKKLPFFMNKDKDKKNEKYDFLMNVTEGDEDVKFIAKTMNTYLNLGEGIRVRMALLYRTGQFNLFRNYLTAIKEIRKGIFALKITRKGDMRKKLLRFNIGHICIMGKWSRKILLYDEITQINIGNSCTSELRLFEKKYQDIYNRSNYVVLRSLYRDYSFLFIEDEKISMRIKSNSPLVKLKKLLNKSPMIHKNNNLNLSNNPPRELKDTTISTTEENCEDIKREIYHAKYENSRGNNFLAKDKGLDKNNTNQGFKYFFLSALKSIKSKNVDMYDEKVKAVIKKNNMIFFDKYDFRNAKINSFFLFCQIELDICGPEIWFTSKFDEMLFTHMN